jgi:trans-aconitate methyltransferase
MGLYKSFVSQTRKPEGFLGKVMLSEMNSGHAKMADWALSCLPDLIPERAADLGCGGGRNARELLRRYSGTKVSAIDHSMESVKAAREYNKDMIAAGRCTVEEGDVSALTLDKSAYDLVTAFETVYFWPGLEKCFRQVAGILKDGGYFLVCNECNGMDSAGARFEKIIDGMRVYTAEQIGEALEKAGFSDVKTERYPNKPWIAVIARK